MDSRKEQLLQGRNQLLETLANLVANELELKKALAKTDSRKESALEDLVQLTSELNKLLEAEAKEGEE